ncbi:hypothetical protein, partial [Salmonella enterica]|uniref:hypothetical protein n=1 Tax=Salmonella enterica TaxID=28901 RepID=UPI001F3CE33B
RTGRTVLTAEEGSKIELMYQSVMSLPLGQWLVESAGDAESSVYWEDPEPGILWRGRPDPIIPGCLGGRGGDGWAVVPG